MNTMSFSCSDGKQLFVRIFDEVESPKAVLLLAHGMSEHSGRYVGFAEYLNGRGILVYAPDHRAHGQTEGELHKIGKPGEGDLFAHSVRDLLELSRYLSEKYPGLPLFEMGHSYGSFLSQEYFTRQEGIRGLILCGSSYFATGLNRLGGLVAGLTCAFKGKNAPAKLINKLSFQSYAKHFENGCWLAQDPAVTEAYNADPFNTQVFSAGFYKYFFRHGTRLYSRERRAGLPKDTPVLLIAGREDPVGQYGKGVERLADFYRRNGLEVTCKLYDKGRHEILNETFREKVWQDVKNFILGRAVRLSDAAQTGEPKAFGEETKS